MERMHLETFVAISESTMSVESNNKKDLLKKDLKKKKPKSRHIH